MTVGTAGLHLAAAEKRKGRREHAFVLEPVVGKDILELLSSAMYVDPLTIFREYVQNSADAIDDAFRQGALSEHALARVDIDLDAQTRTIRIRDNGTGIRAADAERVLTAFGASGKRGTSARGFRGVGRLAAFGYAQTVTFKAKAEGESVSTSVRWDCRRLKAALLDPENHDDLSQTVRDVVTVVEEEAPNLDAHYFEVTLERVVRIKNDVLLNQEEVWRYLSEIAPAPFHPTFDHAPEINRLIGSHVAPSRFRMFLNDSPEPITRPHRREFAISKTKSDVAAQVEAIQIPNSDGGLLAVGWILHHSYLGAIHGSDGFRGLRARVGDIQVGNDDIFVDVFPESRFNSWTIGEIHILDRRITPNGRRDGFEQTAAFADLHAQLAPIGRMLTVKCRQSSARRNRVKMFDQRAERIEGICRALGQRGNSSARSASLRRQAGDVLTEMRKLANPKFLPEGDLDAMKGRIGEAERKLKRFKEVGNSDDHFLGVPRARRIIYEQMLDLIYKAIPSRSAANKLVDKILAQLHTTSRSAKTGKRTGTPKQRKKRST